MYGILLYTLLLLKTKPRTSICSTFHFHILDQASRPTIYHRNTQAPQLPTRTTQPCQSTSLPVCQSTRTTVYVLQLHHTWRQRGFLAFLAKRTLVSLPLEGPIKYSRVFFQDTHQKLDRNQFFQPCFVPRLRTLPGCPSGISESFGTELSSLIRILQLNTLLARAWSLIPVVSTNSSSILGGNSSKTPPSTPPHRRRSYFSAASRQPSLFSDITNSSLRLRSPYTKLSHSRSLQLFQASVKPSVRRKTSPTLCRTPGSTARQLVNELTSTTNTCSSDLDGPRPVIQSRHSHNSTGTTRRRSKNNFVFCAIEKSLRDRFL